MYKRIRDGLFAPKKIIEYIKDKMYMPFLMVFLYAILMTIPVIINNLTSKGLDYNTKDAIAYLFNGTDIDFKIENGELINKSAKADVVFEKELNELLEIRISETENKNLKNKYVIEFSKTGFCVRFAYFKIFEESYQDYEEITNIDLSLLANRNSTTWDDVFSVVDKIVVDYNHRTIVASSISSIIRYAFYIIVVALLLSLSFVFRFRTYLNYSAMFKMSIYYTAPFAFGIILNNLFSLNIFSTIGIIISVFYTFIGSTSIITRLMSSDRK